MIPAAPANVWVYFFTDPAGALLNGSKNQYEILETILVSGQSSFPEFKGTMIRLETPTPLPSGTKPQPELKGAVRHLQYTSAEVRSELQKKSSPVYPPSASTLAVLIPIRKSEKWWSFSQDERQKHFERNGARNHTAIGQDYAARIYRKLYHSRYLETETPLGYDFLTYFEFDRKDRPLFESLLAELRNVKINPEWQFVDFEMEIWMAKK